MESPIGTQLFLVIRYDRHTDDEITAHATREGADAAVDEFKSRYAECGYTWSERPVRKWLRLAETDSDDGPRVHVEASELSR